MGKIIEIPFSGNLVEFVADRLLVPACARKGIRVLEGERESDFSSTGVVFAQQQPAFYPRQMMAEKLNRPFFPPRNNPGTQYLIGYRPSVVNYEVVNKAQNFKIF